MVMRLNNARVSTDCQVIHNIHEEPVLLSSEGNSSPFALKLLPDTATKSEEYLRKGFEISRKDESPRVNF